MQIVNWRGTLKSLVLLLLSLLFLFSGCRKSLTVTFPPSGEQSVTGTDTEGEANPNQIKANECYDQGDYAGALEYLQIALKEETKAYGADHPNVALVLNNIGEAYFGLGDMENALDIFQRALTINLAKLGAHNNTAAVYGNIGRVYSATGDYDRAMENLEFGLAIDIQVHGEDSHEVAVSYDDIATVYQNTGDFDKALEYYNKELFIEQKVSGENSGKVGIIYNNIALLYSTFQMYPQALNYYEKASFICEQVWGTDHYYWGKANFNLGGLYYKMKEYDKSVEYSEIALSVYEKRPMVYQQPLAGTYTTLALDHYYLDDMELSLQYGVKAYQSILAYPYATVSEVQEYKDNLERIYTESGNDPAGFEQWLASQ